MLFRVEEARAGRRFLAAIAPSVSRGDPAPAGGPPLVNLSVSWNGLRTLAAFDGLGGEVAANDAFYIFNEPPNAESLRVAGDSGPRHWWNGRFATGDIHIIVHLAVAAEDELADITLRVRRAAEEAGLRELVPTLDGEAVTGRQIDGRRLHFGFQDGISHPDIDWDSDAPRAGALPRGDFLLGYPSPHFSTYPDESPFSDFARDGSLMAFMLVHQDVAAFNDFLRVNGPKVSPGLPQDEAEEYLAARMMGRWRNGAPLALYPDRPAPEGEMRDDFGYANDPRGLRCPVGAHIRLANARDQPLNRLNQDLFPSGFPRLIRRGSPYGPPLDGTVDDGVDRGLVGMFLCANLNKQFYTVMRWLGRTDFSDLLPDQVGQDPITGTRSFPGASPTFSVAGPDGRPVELSHVDFVKLKGVSLQFLPSLRALEHLSSL